MSKEFDLHCHTTNSDGRNTPPEMVQRGKEIGLDAMAITDHNIATETHELQDTIGERIEIIPGFELSFVNGHYLVIGLEPEKANVKLEKLGIDKGSTAARKRKEEVRDILWWAVDEGALVIVAHPCIPTGIMSTSAQELAKLWDKGFVHGAESNNHGVRHHLGKIVYSAWQRSVASFLETLGMPAYANSDAHKAKHLGRMHNQIARVGDISLVETLRQRGGVEITQVTGETK